MTAQPTPDQPTTAATGGFPRSAFVDAAATILSAGTRVPFYGRVANLMGCSRHMVWKMVGGQRRVSDRSLEMLSAGLRDLAIRCERLADQVDAELIEGSQP